MPIPGQANINIGAENEAANSDSLFTAFNKTQNNFTTLFSQSSQYTNFVGSTGILANSDSANKTVTVTNTGVTRLNAGTGITLSGANGNVIISVSGYSNGTLVAGVTNVGIFSTTLRVTNSPIVSQGNMTVDLPIIDGLSPGTYQNPLVAIDSYGRITSAQNTYSYGTVTSVAIANGSGISVSGGPITSAGTITLTNTGVTKVSAGPGILVNQETGEVTISANLSQFVGTVSRVTVTSNSLFISNPTITTAGNIAIDLPNSISISGNITNFGNTSTYGNIWANRNFEANGNITANGNIVLSAPSKLRIAGGTNGYVLATDGAGNLTWTAQTGGGGGGGSPGGSNTQVQFNNAGAFGGSSGFTFNNVTGVLTAPNIAGNGSAIFSITGANVTGSVPLANVVTATAQPNITSLGNLTTLCVAGNITSANLSVTGVVNAATIISTTAPNNTSNTQVATTAFVQNAVSGIISGSGYAPINSPNFIGTPQAPTIDTTVTGSNALATTNYVKNSLSSYAPLASPTFTGTPQAPTIGQTVVGSNALATTAYVKSAVSAIATGITTINAATPLSVTTPSTGTANLSINLSSYALLASPAFTGTPTAPTQLQSVNDTSLATTAYVRSAISVIGSGTFVTGMIMMWTGSVAPSGWALCNGQNGTPDLRDRFVVGSGTSYNLGSVGGSKDAVIVRHNHTATSTSTSTFSGTSLANHTHSVNEGNGHDHATHAKGTFGGSPYSYLSNDNNGYSQGGGAANFGYSGSPDTQLRTSTEGVGITINAASAGTPSGIVTTTTSTTTANEGETGTNKNLPPYYALAFIMKL